MDYARAYSLSDRMRYYLPHRTVAGSIETLFENLKGRVIPIALLHQYLPRQAVKVVEGALRNNAEDCCWTTSETGSTFTSLQPAN